jgi:tellurite resistance protein TerA
MKDYTSKDSLAEASRDRAHFSGHGNSKGAAGQTELDPPKGFLSKGQTHFFDIQGSCTNSDQFGEIFIDAAWNNIEVEDTKGLFGGFFGKTAKRLVGKGTDIDLGCLYQLKDGSRGCLQAFGDLFGDYHDAPFITLSGDERTGNNTGIDEYFTLNGTKWDQIERLLIYVYIYDGQANWQRINPQITIRIPNYEPIAARPALSDDILDVCAIAELISVNNGIMLKGCSEYFPGQSEMDRAFGYGIDWGDGSK